MDRISKLLTWFLCKIGDHDWTTNAQEGIMPTDKQMLNNIKGWRDYAKMYCKHCGTISELSYH